MALARAKDGAATILRRVASAFCRLGGHVCLWAGALGAAAAAGLLTVMELVAITAAPFAIDSPEAGLVYTGYGVASLLSGVSLTLVGIAVIRTKPPPGCFERSRCCSVSGCCFSPCWAGD